MADPEQIYQEVLAEEQAKGSAPPVAEGRAKAARQRAHEGSPHPKEAKWWPGSQPRFEGGSAAVAVAEEVEAPAAEEPVEEPVAAAPVPEPVVDPADVAVEAPPMPADPVQPAAAAPQPAAVAAAPATATQLPPEMRAPGVTHGTPTGNRLRPEDAVGTDGQFEAQKAVYERRKLIDELVATGVPAVTAEREHERSGGGFLVLVYLVIVALAIGFVVANKEDLGAGGGGTGAESQSEGGGAEGEGGGGGATTAVSAAGVAFDTDSITLAADAAATITFTNEDTVPHNISIYSEQGGENLFKGEVINGGQEIDYQIPALEAGEYYFQCDVHPAMAGTVTVQ